MLIMKKIFFFGLLIAASVIVRSQTNSITLQQAVETGIKNNLDVQQSNLRVHDRQKQMFFLHWRDSQIMASTRAGALIRSPTPS